MRLALRSGAFGMAGLMVVAAVAFGKSPAGSLLHLGDGGAWLSNARKGSVTHVNGVAGKADAGVKLLGANGHRLKVIQDGTTTIVIDEVTGEVSRIDPSQLNVAQSASYGAAGVDAYLTWSREAEERSGPRPGVGVGPGPRCGPGRVRRYSPKADPAALRPVPARCQKL